ncbi:MAG TPA: UDP-N-acetylmuramoyl-L-alanyl-D-glutamate--2,6-diaminopimelate ligase [Acidimicrobiia bacterium]|nr:UDP-N-acetylmuramoyl-L-alanyl-D-glutamate--2,6-diaminopimelate ligase [Acidimicrobiia bacterium]
MRDAVTLRELAGSVSGRVVGEAAVAVSDVTHDSRAAGPGVLFVAVRGFTVDGHDFVTAAAAAGAPAVCVEDEDARHGLPAIVVDDTRAALGALASAVHGNPSEFLRLVGVTGTNGKTTVTHLIESIADAAGLPHAIVGTVGARIGGEPVPVARTTPEATDFQRLLARMVAAGVDVAAVEVSSHALALGRVAATRFTVAAFTNLSRDHLDFHGDMASYLAAKASLFDHADEAVVWVDDPAGATIADRLTIPVTSVGGEEQEVHVAASDIEVGFGGSRFTARGRTGSADIDLPLAGRFNVANALVAAACAEVLGVRWAEIAAGIASVPPVPGRFELVPTPAEFTVVVDYAHTPNGIVAAVAAARDILGGNGRVITVVGAGGDRDRDKRPLMGAAAAAADVAVLTSDNPRSEDPAEILASVAAGAQGSSAVVFEEIDRRRAIRKALEEARPGDAVLILGKGHEPGQDLGSRMVPFDDRVVAREEAAAL